MSAHQIPAVRMRRILALVPWIAEHPGTQLADLAQRFGVTEKELERDLELLWLCGLPPYTPDRLIDMRIDDGRVSIGFAEYFARPVRFTPGEGLSLLTAGRALLAVPGSERDGALASALAKLEGALGAPDQGVAVDIGGPPFLASLRDAAAEHQRLEIDYYSHGRNELTTRRIDPHTVFCAFGHWYVDAWCHRASDERLFRVDRVRAVRATTETFDARAAGYDDIPSAVYHPAESDPRVTLLLPPEAGWLVETHPYEEVDEQADGSLRVVIVVSEVAWLERLLLRIGPGATVLDPPELRDTARGAAERVLARYSSDPG